MQRSRTKEPVGLRLDLSPPVRLDPWAIAFALGILVGTILPPFGPTLVVASLVVCAGTVLWRDLVPRNWRLMAVLLPLFAAGGVGVAFLHSAYPDPLADLASLEPGPIMIVGKVASPPVQSSFGYRTDIRVEHLWYEGKEILRGGGVEVFAQDLEFGVGDEVRVDG